MHRIYRNTITHTPLFVINKNNYFTSFLHPKPWARQCHSVTRSLRYPSNWLVYYYYCYYSSHLTPFSYLGPYFSHLRSCGTQEASKFLYIILLTKVSGFLYYKKYFNQIHFLNVYSNLLLSFLWIWTIEIYPKLASILLHEKKDKNKKK